MRKSAWFVSILAVVMLAGVAVSRAQKPAEVSASPAPANLTIRVVTLSGAADALLDPEARAWEQVAAKRIALNRTPPLYDTDPPATIEIPELEVRIARAGGKLLVHLAWRDATQDFAELMPAPQSPYETRNRKEQSAATERFFDAAAVMFPTRAPAGDVSPSLQMGDVGEPVTIYYWNAARGAMLMEAQGRGTTRRTGQTFPARGNYRAGTWRVVLELPELPAGRGLAFAVWNGSQLDRDGRKYFSVWHWLE